MNRYTFDFAPAETIKNGYIIVEAKNKKSAKKKLLKELTKINDKYILVRPVKPEEVNNAD